MDRLPHFLIQSTARKFAYVSPKKGRGKEFNNPLRDRMTHGPKLAESVKQIEIEVQNETEKPATGVSFVPIVVSSDPEFELKLDRLDNKTLKIINVRHEDNGSQVATIHIPVNELSKFIKKFELVFPNIYIAICNLLSCFSDEPRNVNVVKDSSPGINTEKLLFL